MKILIVLDHMSLIPAFMQTHLQYASKVFDSCYHINTRKPANSEVVKEYGVNICYPSFYKSKTGIIKGFFALFKPIVIKQIVLCCSQKGIKWKYLKSLLAWMVADNRTRPIADQIIRKHKGDDITVLSTWFGACSYTNAKLKEKFPFIKAVSLAHSYEVLVSRDEFIPYYFVDYRHKLLDGIFFISEKIRQFYFEGIGQLRPEYIGKTHINYLGTYKNNDVLNPKNEQVFHICTCSRMVPLKRLDLLINALRSWSDSKIQWTHIGNGPLYESLKREANNVVNENPLVKILFMGRISNQEVKTFYETTPIDLFVNLSNNEGVPVSIMEAISYGIPVIATDVGGTSEIVTKETGFIIPAEISYLDVMRYLQNFHNRSETEKNNLRLSAHQFWKENFNAQSNIRNFYHSVDSITLN